MNSMSIALNKMTDRRWDPANIRPPPPENIRKRGRVPAITPSVLSGDDEFKTALSGGETYHIPEPEWHPDTVFFAFAYLQAQAADPYEYEKLL
ncbi:hypothetical protein E8E11_001923 [Didymella keratinophila]|nr:hypothetical protein E8E11_001923 [Didymella keratinophila]